MACPKVKFAHVDIQIENERQFSLVCTIRAHDCSAGMKMVTKKSQRNFDCRKCEENIGETVEQEKRYVMKWKQ